MGKQVKVLESTPHFDQDFIDISDIKDSTVPSLQIRALFVFFSNALCSGSTLIFPDPEGPATNMRSPTNKRSRSISEVRETYHTLIHVFDAHRDRRFEHSSLCCSALLKVLP